jgi:ribosomal protein L24
MLVKRHVKPVPQLNREGGIKEQEAWVSISNVALIDPDTGKPTRVKYEIQDGKKVRVAKSGKVIPENTSYKREDKKKIDDEETETSAPTAEEAAAEEKPKKKKTKE